ncbi:hypothetical protein SAMN04487905_111109 [Actinopolyspora xinjiangensis]|uniref:Uncharacterized protein n=1 Tax=Actinopolyspora xinjiangensis TaxID=405564 RepID=A0A1H0WAG0_9ACTN|nr:hypothetical protein [Actinopolyspora xinjiangensis]SDP87531.1 hypothetical protein SAMN04487905_111109 [Actinopolyspora xinjiangensis]
MTRLYTAEEITDQRFEPVLDSDRGIIGYELFVAGDHLGSVMYDPERRGWIPYTTYTDVPIPHRRGPIASTSVEAVLDLLHNLRDHDHIGPAPPGRE